MITEIVPKCKDYKPHDPLYREARDKVAKQVTAMESVRLKLIEEYDAYFKIRVFAPKDLFNEFRQSFKDPNHTILLLDFRAMEVFINGHLKWISHPSSKIGGIVHIEPELIASW
jgi:hypothetical protein